LGWMESDTMAALKTFDIGRQQGAIPECFRLSFETHLPGSDLVCCRVRRDVNLSIHASKVAGVTTPELPVAIVGQRVPGAECVRGSSTARSCWLPMYQAEAMWISVQGKHDRDRGVEYPFAIKITTGKVSAASGKNCKVGLTHRPQDSVVLPAQP